MQKRWSPNSGRMEPGLAGVGDLEPASRCRAGGAKTRQAAPAHFGHRACKRSPGRAAGHLADGGQRVERPPPRGSSADPLSASAPSPLPPGPRPQPRRRPLFPDARPGCMEPGAVSRTAEPTAAREVTARHAEGRKKMAAAVATAAAAAASYAPLTPMVRAGRRAADGGGGGSGSGPGSGEGRGEAGRGPAGGGGRVGGWREAVGTVCCARNMAGVGDTAAPGEGSGGGGGADGPERDGRGEAEQPGGGGGGHGPPPAPQHTETLGFYESDRRRERRRSRAGEASGRAALGRAEGAEGGGERRAIPCLCPAAAAASGATRAVGARAAAAPGAPWLGSR